MTVSGRTRRREMLRWIHQYVKENQFPPTVRELGQAFNFSSPATSHFHLDKMEEDGLIKRGGGPRQLAVTNKGRKEIAA